jgi:hypothetical protein
MAGHKFKKIELVAKLEAAKGKTLGQLDVNNVFAKTVGKPKITGIAGDVIEQSVLGYPPDSEKKPDLIVNGVPTEEKTTGMLKNGDGSFKAKEPCSITAVSPKDLVNEKFKDSSFWHKAENILFVFYHYNKRPPVPSWEYKDFTVEGYNFFKFNDTDEEALQKDWQTVHDYVVELRTEYPDDKEFMKQIPHISSVLRTKLFMMDLVPRKAPRFRLKQSIVQSIVHDSFSAPLEQLQETYKSYDDVDLKCKEITAQYKGWTIEQIFNHFHLTARIKGKSIGEHIILKMFEGTASKLNKIELFSKYGIIGKSVTLTRYGKRSEDMKLFQIDFREIYDDSLSEEDIGSLSPEEIENLSPEEIENLLFEKSEYFTYFSERQMLVIVFEEPSLLAPLKDNKFVGFKRISFSEEFIMGEVKNTWKQIRDIVLNNKLEDVPTSDKDGTPKINKKSQEPSSAPNFPKSKNNIVFVRGSGKDSSKKTQVVNGISMYAQYVWIKGTYIAKQLTDVEFI